MNPHAAAGRDSIVTLPGVGGHRLRPTTRGDKMWQIKMDYFSGRDLSSVNGEMDYAFDKVPGKKPCGTTFPPSLGRC